MQSTYAGRHLAEAFARISLSTAEVKAFPGVAGLIMLFNSYVFIFLFLPVALGGFYALASWSGPKAARLWVVLASLYFYGYWNLFGISPVEQLDLAYFLEWNRWKYLVLFFTSLAVNFAIGRWIERSVQSDARRRALLVIGVVFDLGLLAYFKYAGFLQENVNELFGTSYSTFNDIILPIGISFYTFQQIGYLVDAYRGVTQERSFLDYLLFICSFWQLIAGPIVHHRQIIPQLRQKDPYRFNRTNFSIGVTVFTIGLFKKLVLADSLALFANRLFALPDGGEGYDPTTLDAWIGALCYMHQVYFDFSGYSDMAIGLGRMFNVAVPTNFNSPYKSVSIIQFWRRWHITLSLFLREYCYYPLGGNRGTKTAKYRNLFITMILAGIWHGANWTFIIFGILHGAMLTMNHWWRELQGKTKYDQQIPLFHFCGYVLLTYFLLCVTLVIFRADSVTDAWIIYKAMFAVESVPDGMRTVTTLPGVGVALVYYFIGLFVVWFLPNTNQFMNIVGPGESRQDNIEWGLARTLRWKPNVFWSIVTAVMFVIALVNLPKANEFLYFQF